MTISDQQPGRSAETEGQKGRLAPGAARGLREEEAERGVGAGLTLAQDARDPIFDVDLVAEDGTGNPGTPRTGQEPPGGVEGADEEIDVNADAAIPNTRPDPESERNRRVDREDEGDGKGDRTRGIEEPANPKR